MKNLIRKIKCWFGWHELWQNPEYKPSITRTCKHCWYYDFKGNANDTKTN